MPDADQISFDDFARDTIDAIPGAELRRRYGSSALKRAVARGDLVRVLPDVYAPAHYAQSFHVRAHAAALWAGGPVSGLAALFLWGLVDIPPDEVEVLAPHGHNPRAQPGVSVRQSVVDLPQSVRRGIPVVSPAVAIVIGYGLLPKALRSDVLYAAVRSKLVGARQLESALAAVPRVKARRGLERSVRAVAAGAQSYLEERALHKVFNTAEFARFRPQEEVVIEGNQFFLDLFDERTKLALEFDGRKGHLNEYRQRNITRDCWVATIGIQTLRFSYDDLVKRPEWCRQAVREVLRARERQLRARSRT